MEGSSNDPNYNSNGHSGGVLASFALLLISMLSAQALAQTFDFDGITYYVNPFTIASDCRSTGSCIGSHGLRDIVMPATVVVSGTTYSVTSVGFQAFRCQRCLTSVTIPDSVTTIGRDAFYTQRPHQRDLFQTALTTIGHAAFSTTPSPAPPFWEISEYSASQRLTVTPKLATITYAQGAAGWDIRSGPLRLALAQQEVSPRKQQLLQHSSNARPNQSTVAAGHHGRTAVASGYQEAA